MSQHYALSSYAFTCALLMGGGVAPGTPSQGVRVWPAISHSGICKALDLAHTLLSL